MTFFAGTQRGDDHGLVHLVGCCYQHKVDLRNGEQFFQRFAGLHAEIFFGAFQLLLIHVIGGDKFYAVDFACVGRMSVSHAAKTDDTNLQSHFLLLSSE